MKSMFFWVVALCSSEEACHFSGRYHLQREGQARNQQEVDLLLAGFLLGLLFEPEDGSGMFLQNVGLFLNYTAL
jgi:hypothetical protein